MRRHAKSHQRPSLCSQKSMQSLGKELLDQFTMHVRQPEIAPLKAISQLRMVKTQQVQKRRVQIMNVHRVLRGIEPKLIRLAQSQARLHTPSSHPHREGIGMVIAAVV